MFLHIRGLSKSFGNEQVIAGLDLDLAEHRTLSILGRSGSGKSSLLRLIAGLEDPDAGTIALAGDVIDKMPPHRRNVVYLYQEPLLFPHLNAFDNIAFGLRLRKEDAATVRRHATAMLQQLELDEHGEKMPHQLSGGQRQRVAFGRALIIGPRLLLLDEPFGALDAETRAGMQDLLRRITAEFRITTIFVTHDLREALLMGDEIAALRGGRLKRYASKAGFIDDPETGVRAEAAFWREILAR